MDEPVISVSNLTRRFGRNLALDQVNVDIGPGQVFGLVGANGAGKTTLIRHILGLLVPDSGDVRVYGMNPVHHPTQVLSRIGYVSEDRDLPPWMRIGQFLDFSRTFYPDWDVSLELELLRSFELDPRKKIQGLSRGEKARVCLVNAISHRPPLLLLDEPSSGLDPVVRRDVLTTIIRTIAEEGRTVIFSSHLLDEVQQVADRIVMLNNGRKVLDQQLDQLFDRFQQYTIVFDDEQTQFPICTPNFHASGSNRFWQVISSATRAEFENRLAEFGGRITEMNRPNLEEIFIAVTRESSESPHDLETC